MTTPIANIHYTFTRKDRNLAEHLFRQAIIKRFGEIWTPKSDGQYIGCSWDCRSMLAIDGGLWRLVEAAIHKGALRAFGKIELRDSGTMLTFVIFWEKLNKEGLT